MKLLLISNSGEPLYTWCKDEIKEFCGRKKKLTYMPYASIEAPLSFFNDAKDALERIGFEVENIDFPNRNKIIEQTEIFFVGGGNTYQLLKRLTDLALLDRIKEKIKKGALYIGVSAGSNIAGPNILTTNDWNVVAAKEFKGLELVPFNINLTISSPMIKES